MSKNITGVIAWLRGWFDDIYAGIGHTHDDYCTEQEVISIIQEYIGLLIPTLSLSVQSSSVSINSNIYLTGSLEYEGNPLSNQTVYLYDNDSLVDTLTTDGNGEVSKTVAASSVGSHTFELSFDGDGQYGHVSDRVIVTVTKLTSTISLSASSGSIYVGDTPFVSGTLSAGSGESVKIYQGATLLDTVTTGSGGAFSYTGSATSSAGTLTYKAVYDGNSVYTSVESSTVNITVNKLSTTTTLATSSASVSVGDTFTLSGTFQAGSTSLSGYTVEIYETYEGLIDEVTTSSGSFSTTVSASDLGTGSFSFYAIAYGDNTYEGSTSSDVSVVITSAPTVASVSLTGDKSIISAYDHESCTLTATVLDSNNQPVSGALVSFDIVSGGSVVSNIDTATTNSSGIATVSYSGNHAGDLNIQASCGIILSQSFVVQDYYYYDSQTVDKSRYTVTTGTANLSYSNNGFKCIGTATTDIFVKNTALTLPTNYEAEFTVTGRVTDSANHYGGICFDDALFNFGKTTISYYRLSTISTLGSVNYSLQDGDVIKVRMENNTCSIYINDVLKISKSGINNTGIYQHRTYNNRGLTIKDLKIREL